MLVNTTIAVSPKIPTITTSIWPILAGRCGLVLEESATFSTFGSLSVVV